MNMCITWILINSVTKAIISLFYPSTSLFVHLCVRLGVSVCLCFSQSVYMSGYQLSVFAFFLQSPSVHLSVHLPLYLMLFFFWFKTKRFFKNTFRFITFLYPSFVLLSVNLTARILGWIWLKVKCLLEKNQRTPQWMIKVDIVCSVCWIDSNYF